MEIEDITKADMIRRTILEALEPLRVAREHLAAYPEGCAPIVEGVTHCESCGFSYRTPRHVVTHRNRCQTPARHA